MSTPWMQTYTGLAAHPFDLCIEQICLEDIAHSLAMSCRFRGHCRDFYSVAQHSVLAAQLAPAHLKRYMLMHDAAEAYLSDVPRPMKGSCSIGDQPFSEFENQVLARILATFAIEGPKTVEDYRTVRRIDDELVVTEGRDLMSKSPIPWGVPAEPLDFVIRAWPWRYAEKRFIECFECLRNGTGKVCIPDNSVIRDFEEEDFGKEEWEADGLILRG